MSMLLSRTLLIAACLTLAACGSSDGDPIAATTTSVGTTTSVESTTSVDSDAVAAAEPEAPPTTEVTADSEVTTELEVTELEVTESEVTESTVAFEDLEDVEDAPLSASIFTEAELDALFPGGSWNTSSRLDAGEPPEDGPDLCGSSLPAFPDGISTDGDRSVEDPTDADIKMSQQIFFGQVPEWVDVFRLLVTCDEAGDILGPVELTPLPVDIEGAIDAVAVQSFEAEATWEHTVVISVLTPTHTMLVSFETDDVSVLDVDAIVALVEQAIARSN